MTFKKLQSAEGVNVFYHWSAGGTKFVCGTADEPDSADTEFPVNTLAAAIARGKSLIAQVKWAASRKPKPAKVLRVKTYKQLMLC
jgi:hypothetical protein